MFDGFGPEKLIVVLLIVLVMFGGKRIPEIGASLGKGIREFKKGMKEAAEPIEDHPAPQASLPSAHAVDDVRVEPEPRRLIQ